MYAYNGDGLRDSRTVGEDTVTFTWHVVRSVPQVIDDGSLSYVYGLGRIAQVAADDTTYYYLSDGLGSTMALTDADGDVVNTYEYDVFGAVRAQTGSQPNEFQFTGEQVDGSTALEYLRARYYNPAVGRFLRQDPIPFIQRYAYVGNNPIAFVDPTGLCGLLDPWDCPVDLATWTSNQATRAAECVSDPVGCAITAFAGSPLDKRLVDVVGTLAARAARSPGQDIDKEGGIRLIENCHSRFCETVFFLTGMDVEGVTIGNTVLAPGLCRPGTPCFRHEATHVRQQREMGFVGFLLEYFGEQTAANALRCLPSGSNFFGCLYRNNALEREARDAALP